MKKKDLESAVFQAADSLFQAKGRKPTNNEVRDEIGGGSMAHISPVMRRWRDLRDEEAAAAMRAPEEVENIAKNMAMKLWHEAKDAAAKEYQALRDKFKQEKNALTEELEQSFDQIEKLKKALTDCENALAAKDRAHEIAQKKIDENVSAISDIRQENARLQAREEVLINQIDDYKFRLQDANAATRDLQNKLVALASSSS